MRNSKPIDQNQLDLNEFDLYLVDTRARQVIRHIGFDTSIYAVQPDQVLMTGMDAKVVLSGG